jgi:hypothetical protein
VVEHLFGLPLVVQVITLTAAARIAATLMVVLTISGCNTLRRATGTQAKADERAEQLQLVQLEVMRYADEYAGRLIGPVTDFQRETQLASERLAAHNWLLSQTTSAYTVASGPNPITNTLDMVVLATLSRMVIEDTWVSELYGERAADLRETHQALEPRAWSLVEEVLTEEQRARLREVIEEWRTRNPKVRAVAYIHFHDFAKAIGHPRAGEANTPGSLFAVLGLDPLSTLDPAVREIAQTRHLAERAIFYLQRAPRLMDMQIQRLTYEFTAMPETRQLLADVNRVSLATGEAGKLAGDLPSVIARERQAAIAQFVDALNAQESQLRALTVELRDALEAGTATSDSLNTTIRSFDSLMARFDKPKAAPANPGAPGRPFDITEYSTAMRELAVTARELEALLRSIDAGTPGFATLTERATEDVNRVIDHLFWRLVILGIILIVGAFGAAFAYRMLARRFA